MNDKYEKNDKSRKNYGSSNREYQPKSAQRGGECTGQSKYDHIQPLILEPLQVKVYGSFDKAMRAFRALVQKERVLSLFKESQSFEKPSDKKRRKRGEMQRKLLELEYKSERDPADYPKKRNREEPPAE